MHSFQPSRGRIIFEVFCAVGIAASCGGAWLQTGASALLAAAVIVTLYGLVHFLDLFRSDATVPAESQRIEFEPQSPEVESAPLPQEVRMSPGAFEPFPVTNDLVLDAEPSGDVLANEGATPPAKSTRPAKPARKVAASAKSSRKAKAAGSTTTPSPEIEMTTVEVGSAVPESHDESAHAPVSPLFEPEPFVRQQQRAMFGRKAG